MLFFFLCVPQHRNHRGIACHGKDEPTKNLWFSGSDSEGVRIQQCCNAQWMRHKTCENFTRITSKKMIKSVSIYWSFHPLLFASCVVVKMELYSKHWRQCACEKPFINIPCNFFTIYWIIPCVWFLNSFISRFGKHDERNCIRLTNKVTHSFG